MSSGKRLTEEEEVHIRQELTELKRKKLVLKDEIAKLKGASVH